MIQSIAFPSSMSDSDVYDYLKEHNLKPMKPIHLIGNWKKARINEPIKHKKYFTKILPNGIHYIYYL